MTLASAGSLVAVAASIFLIAGPSPASPAAVIPAQYAMGTPPRRSPPSRTDTALTPEEGKRLTEAINRLPKKQRKRLAQAVQRLNPEERKQFIQAVKRQLAAKGTAAAGPAAGEIRHSAPRFLLNSN